MVDFVVTVTDVGELDSVVVDEISKCPGGGCEVVAIGSLVVITVDDVAFEDFF